jgi:hypothetical protein
VFGKQALYCLSYTSRPFCSDYFGDGGLTNYLPGLAENHDPPNLASQVARITGMSHQCIDRIFLWLSSMSFIFILIFSFYS